MTVATHKTKLTGPDVDFPKTGPWRKVEDGKLYVVLYPCLIGDENVVGVAYCAVFDDGMTLVLPLDKFMDGRFK